MGCPNSSERSPDDLQEIRRHVLARVQLCQRRAGVLLAAGIELPPAIEAACQARGDLRIDAVDLADLLGEKMVAAAVGGVKTNVVVAEGVEQGVNLVRVAQIERRVREQTCLLYTSRCV